MRNGKDRLRIGIVGCGAIGSRIALSTKKELKSRFMVSALYDIDCQKSRTLAQRLNKPSLVKPSIQETIHSSDIVVEAVNTSATRDIVRQAISLKRSVLAMSVGRLLGQSRLFSLAEKNHCSLLMPSGAIAGLDAVKAASLAGIKKMTLTTRKPPQGFADNPYLRDKGISLKDVKEETVVFDGPVHEAVRYFPQNINVAAALSMAAGDSVEVKVRIIASPDVSRNTHEIVLEGPFGRITTRTENEICPDNPKTSYLAVLSGVQTLKQFYQHVKIGT